MVLDKKWPFFQLFLLRNIGYKNVFYDILKRKNAFLEYKKRSSESRKIDIFPKGLTRGFCLKMAIFPNFFLGNIGHEYLFYNIVKRKNAFLGYKIKKFKKSKNWHFSKGVNPRFWSKNGHFSRVVFLGNIGQDNVFYDILEREYAFPGYKKKKFKKSKYWHFSNGVNPWFWSKSGYFSNVSFLANIVQENVFYDILEKKTDFLGLKNQKFKKPKTWHFSKGVVNPGFWTKNGQFLISFCYAT